MSRGDTACKVYVGELDPKAEKREIEDCFSKIGPIKNVWVARNPPGFAFVEYEDPRDAHDACKHLDGEKIGSGRVKVEMSRGGRGGRRDDGGRRGGRGGGGGYGGGDRFSPPRRPRSPPPRRRSSSRERPSYRRYSRSRSRSR